MPTVRTVNFHTELALYARKQANLCKGTNKMEHNNYMQAVKMLKEKRKDRAIARYIEQNTKTC